MGICIISFSKHNASINMTFLAANILIRKYIIIDKFGMFENLENKPPYNHIMPFLQVTTSM